MSTQVNQYFIYGIALPFSWCKEWETRTGRNFLETFQRFISNDEDARKLYNPNNLYCVFNGRDGKYIIIGKLLEDNLEGNAIIVPIMPLMQEEFIQNLIFDYFELKGNFHYYYITYHE